MSKEFYDPKHPDLKQWWENENDSDPSYDRDNYIEEKQDGLFHIGQSYEEDPCKTVYCKQCGGSSFNVGRGDYFTGIRCTTCLYEICIHEG